MRLLSYVRMQLLFQQKKFSTRTTNFFHFNSYVSSGYSYNIKSRKFFNIIVSMPYIGFYLIMVVVPLGTSEILVSTMQPIAI